MADQPKSIYLTADGELIVQSVTENYTPGESECLIRVKYSGINPCDLNFYYIGLNSFITGFELSGTVEQTGPNSPFLVGDAVCGIAPLMMPMPSSLGTHQDFAIAKSELLYKVPDGLSLKDAGVICMAAHTAADALFNVLGLGFPAADVPGLDATGKGLLIWGGASGVGNMAIQMAKAAGFEFIFVTASAKNHVTLKDLGATHCFDYKSPTVVEDIQHLQKTLGVKLSMAFDTVGKGVMEHASTTRENTPSLAKRALSPDRSETRVVCTLPVAADPEYGFCTSYRPKGSYNAMGAPQDPEAPKRVRTVMEYLLEMADRAIKLPVVTAVSGAEAGIEAIKRVARGDASQEKLVLEHPLQG
ncbi:PKS-ER domain-containing protein [Fusarium sp. LHS14.1]|nr:PKS-ER domain-containing protein [Fusarium sp. LHS14.1]